MSEIGHGVENRARRQGLWLAVSLFFLAPLVGEFLLGNTPITSLPAVLLLAPMYGGGALLIRETARRTGRGWPTMVLLAAAYGLIEEGPIDQLLWNPHYGGIDMGLVYAETYVPLIGTSIELVQDVLTMHTIWSICVPIAIIEAFSRDRTRPWLGNAGLAVTGVVFAAGSVFLAVIQHTASNFMASPAQFAKAAVAILVLIVLAFTLGHRPAHGLDATAPSSWVVGAVAFGGGSLYFGHDPLLPDEVSAWVPTGGWFVLVGILVVLCSRWSLSRGWGAAHRLALTGGALLTYVWVGFMHTRELGIPYAVGVLGSVVFGVGALILLVAAARAEVTAVRDFLERANPVA